MRQKPLAFWSCRGVRAVSDIKVIKENRTYRNYKSYVRVGKQKKINFQFSIFN